MTCLLRRFYRWRMYRQWRATLPFGERVRLDYWGATGNADHHPFAWADFLPGEKER
jgi:hypothetical protein